MGIGLLENKISRYKWHSIDSCRKGRVIPFMGTSTGQVSRVLPMNLLCARPGTFFGSCKLVPRCCLSFHPGSKKTTASSLCDSELCHHENEKPHGEKGWDDSQHQSLEAVRKPCKASQIQPSYLGIQSKNPAAELNPN